MRRVLHAVVASLVVRERAEGRIHFAGDHASSSPGWMEGALESAERVVREIEDASRAGGDSRDEA